MSGGFGNFPFGNSPFGNENWAKTVLWDELPDYDKNTDLKAGGWFYKFVTCLMPSFNQMKRLIDNTYDQRINPRTVRKDLIRYVAGNFGINIDYEEPEVFQRMSIEIASRWRLIKGKRESYEILGAIHGFNVVVNEIWWDGEKYSTFGPSVENEQIGVIP